MSRRFTIDQSDWRAILRSILIAGAGAGFAEVLHLLELLDWGQWTPVVTAASAVLVNIVRKWVVSSGVRE